MTSFLRMLLLALTLFSVSSFAGQIPDLYKADVSASAKTEQWQQEALSQVLQRVSGLADIANQAALSEELRRASTYIKQFEAVRTDEGNRMQVLLDANKVNQLLQQNNIAVWGALRPDILVWLVEQKGSERQFIRRQEQTLRKALRQAFKQSALPLLSPLYDMDDLLRLTETDVWAGFWQPINQASSRYNAEVVVAATVEQLTTENGNEFRISWQYVQDGRVIRDEAAGTSEALMMQQFASRLASQLAQQYATTLSVDAAQHFILTVKGVSQLPAIVRVQKALQQVVGVSEVTIGSFDNGSVQYRVKAAINAEGLLNALRFNPSLQLDTSAQMIQLDANQPPVLATLIYTGT